MIKKRTYIILLIILISFFLIMFIALGINNIRSEQQETTIIIGNQTIWNYKKRKWTTISNNSQIEKLNWKKYNIYLNNEKAGDYYLWHSDKWYTFDNQKKAINLDGDILAIKSDNNIKVYPLIEEEITDFTLVNKILEENQITDNQELTTKYRISIDFDNDGSKEYFYVISNIFPEKSNPDSIFSIVFMEKDNKTYMIYKDITSNKSFNSCKPYFTGFLDVNNDNKAEFILSCASYSVSKTTNSLYSFTKDEFKILISS